MENLGYQVEKSFMKGKNSGDFYFENSVGTRPRLLHSRAAGDNPNNNWAIIWYLVELRPIMVHGNKVKYFSMPCLL